MGWRQEAFECLPEFRELLQEEKSAYNFFGELVSELEEAYETENEDLIERIYQLVFRCFAAPRGKDASDDLPSAVACSFLEEIPQHKLIRQNIGRWFRRSDILGMSEIFHYHGTEEQYQEMLKSCDKRENRKARSRNMQRMGTPPAKLGE